MYNHAPVNYKCPICLGVNGIENDDTMLKQADLVYKDKLVSVFINSFWIPTAEGHVIVVPNQHYENLYELPEEYRHHIIDIAQKIALAMKTAYRCDGITLRQNNEPASSQHAFHFHLHIFPRYEGDSFDINLTKKSIVSEPKKRIEYVNKLKDILQKNN
jgi:histidine triad (HIT) family protein